MLTNVKQRSFAIALGYAVWFSLTAHADIFDELPLPSPECPPSPPTLSAQSSVDTPIEHYRSRGRDSAPFRRGVVSPSRIGPFVTRTSIYAGSWDTRTSYRTSSPNVPSWPFFEALHEAFYPGALLTTHEGEGPEAPFIGRRRRDAVDSSDSEICLVSQMPDDTSSDTTDLSDTDYVPLESLFSSSDERDVSSDKPETPVAHEGFTEDDPPER